MTILARHRVPRNLAQPMVIIDIGRQIAWGEQVSLLRPNQSEIELRTTSDQLLPAFYTKPIPVDRIQASNPMSPMGLDKLIDRAKMTDNSGDFPIPRMGAAPGSMTPIPPPHLPENGTSM